MSSSHDPFIKVVLDSHSHLIDERSLWNDYDGFKASITGERDGISVQDSGFLIAPGQVGMSRQKNIYDEFHGPFLLRSLTLLWLPPTLTAKQDSRKFSPQKRESAITRTNMTSNCSKGIFVMEVFYYLELKFNRKTLLPVTPTLAAWSTAPCLWVCVATVAPPGSCPRLQWGSAIPGRRRNSTRSSTSRGGASCVRY